MAETHNGQTAADEERNKALLRQWLHQTMNVTILGIMSCLPKVRPDIVLVNCCGIIGMLMAETWKGGDPIEQINFRLACTNAFKAGLASVAQPDPNGKTDKPATDA